MPTATDATGRATGSRRRTWTAGAALLLAVIVGGAAAACTSSSDTAASWDDAAAGGASAADTAAAGSAVEAGAPSQAAGAESSAGGDASAASGAGGSEAEQAAGESASGGGSGTDGAGSADTAPADPATVLQGRQVIRTGSFTLEVTVSKTDDADADQKALRQKVSGIAVKARAAATGVGGYISASEGDGVTQSITMRIPVDKYDAARAGLGALGELTGSENSEDVTGAMADMDGRIKTMKAGVNRIRELLTKASSIKDIIAIESELNEREADLEALLGKRAAMADQVALSTITLVVSGSVSDTRTKASDSSLLAGTHLSSPGPSGFAGGLAGAIDVIKNIGAGLAIFLGVLVPFLPLLIVVLLALPWLRRRFGQDAAASGQ